MKKRNGVVLTSAVLLVSLLLGGCGSKEGAVKTTADVAASKEHVYKTEELKLGDIDQNNVNDIFYLEDKMVVMGQYWREAENSAEEEETSSVQPRTTDASEEAEVEAAADTEVYEEIESVQIMKAMKFPIPKQKWRKMNGLIRVWQEKERMQYTVYLNSISKITVIRIITYGKNTEVS